MKNQPILRVVAKLLIPYILLYAFYVQWHGDYGPGGGFQAGVIFAAGIILYALIFGLQAAESAIRPQQVRARVNIEIQSVHRRARVAVAEHPLRPVAERQDAKAVGSDRWV